MKKQFITIAEEKKTKEDTLTKRARFWFKNKKYLSQGFAQKVKKARTLATAVLIVSFVAQIGMGIFGTKATSVGVQGPNDPQLEGSLAVANVTRGVNYREDYVDALVDDVVKFEMAFHNFRPPDSGIVAHNVLVKITLPSGTSTNLVATGYAAGSNTGTVTDTAAVHTQVPAFLDYIPGSAKWRHNIGTNENPNWVTQDISDSVTSTGFNVGDINPCQNFIGTITILARVKASALKVEKKVTIPGTPWVKENSANMGDTLSYLITFTNMGNTQLTNMIVGDNLPPYVTYVPGSTTLYNTNHPSGIAMPDGVTTGGIRVGDYNPGSNGYVKFKVTINQGIPYGNNRLKNVGIAKADQTPEVWDTAITNVNVVRPQQPEFTISKSAFNETQGVDATTTLAHAGDVVRYTLTTSNVGDAPGQYTISDDIGDILQYANLTNNGGGTLTGNVISYGTVTINPSETVSKTFNVQVMPFLEWPSGGDLAMVNIYGNQIIVRLGFSNIIQAKSAFNNTQSADAQTRIARAGDVITYTLVTSNPGNESVGNYVVSDDISDILDYADVTDTGSGTLGGGVISWSAVNITAGGSVQNTFQVKVKSPIPGNPQNGTRFDFRMENVYGNKVTVELEKPAIAPPAILGVAAMVKAGGGSLLLTIASMLFMFISSAFLYFREKLLLLNTLRNI